MNKRILIFSTAYHPLIGGAEIAVKEITDRLPQFEFVLITAKLKKDLPDTEHIGNVTVYRLGIGTGFDKYRLILQGWKKAKELGKFDAVWSIMASYAGFAALRYKKRNPTIPFLLTLQEGDSRWDIYKHVWWCWPYFKQIFKRADKIQAISNYLADWAKKLGATCPIDVVPNGTPLILIPSGQFIKESDNTIRVIPEIVTEIDAINKKNNLHEEDKLVITTSRLVKKNGIEYLIKAMQQLPSNYKLRILGDGKLRHKLEKLVNRLDIKDRVVFFGEVEYSQLFKYYFSDNPVVFVRPSLSEGLGNAFLEAMSISVPVIATPVGGISDFLREGETGWFCEVKNPKNIAEKIRYVMDEKNRDLVSRVTERANKMVFEKYTWGVIAKQMKKLFV